MFLKYDPSLEYINNVLFNGSLDSSSIALLKKDLDKNTVKSKRAHQIAKFVNEYAISLDETGGPGHASWRCEVADNVFVYANKDSPLKALVFFALSLVDIDESLKGRVGDVK